MERELHLSVPLVEMQVRELRVGDTVYLTGLIIQMRSAAHARAAEYLKLGHVLPFELRNMAIYHGFSCNQQRKGEWHLCYIGPTLSYRMSRYAPELISKGGVRAFIGKAGAGMGEEALEAMRKYGCVHLSQVGGVTAYNTSQVVRCVGVYWEDLAPDQVFAYEVSGLGPLVVTMDAHGQNLYLKQHRAKEAALAQLLQECQ